MKPTPRPCDGCTQCCEVLSISEIDKPACQKCPHQIDGTGCGIYNARPIDCRTFECLYSSGENRVTTDADRPDRIGAVFSFQMDAFRRGAVICHVLDMSTVFHGRIKKLIEKFNREGADVYAVTGHRDNEEKILFRKKGQ